MNVKLIRYNFIFLFFVAVLGSIMRFFPLQTLPFNYPNILHAHSHVAFQGWVYLSLFYLIVKQYLNEKEISSGKYKLQFMLTVAVVTCILISFTYQGYGLFSIVFSTLFQLLNYWFIIRFFNDVKKNELVKLNSLPLRFIKASLWFNLLSTMAPWAIGIISAKGLSGSEAYHSAIYFFLHFQYNGWFTFAIFGLFFLLLEKFNISYHIKSATNFFIFLVVSVVPAYSLSLLGMSYKTSILYVAYFAAILQLVSIIFFINSIKSSISVLFQNFNNLFSWIIVITACSFLLKLVSQSLSVLEIFQQIAFTNRNIIIAFIHLVMLGFVSLSLIGFFIKFEIFSLKNSLTKIGILFLIFGFVITEILLVTSGFISSQLYQIAIFIFSILMTIGVGLLLLRKNNFEN